MSRALRSGKPQTFESFRLPIHLRVRRRPFSMRRALTSRPRCTLFTPATLLRDSASEASYRVLGWNINAARL
jgi:hypothetical protein